ncbi:hypothetical protein WJX75_004588 [Coccomyxa subellipsoidea]|uniref:CR-type domain-containing protein n=1 Tax=Coccomyxa subellipsoidea TaxID=248742 RepID=A0ABR2YC83_9CHLO
MFRDHRSPVSLQASPAYRAVGLQSSRQVTPLSRQPYREAYSRRRIVVTSLFGKKTPQVSEGKPCKKCKSKGSLTCPSCKGTGKNKKNGNVFERWK